MQEIFIKAVTAPDDSRDIMHYETYYYGITEMFETIDEAEWELLRQVDKEIRCQLEKLESDYFYKHTDKHCVCHNINIISLVKRKAEIRQQATDIRNDDRLHRPANR